MAVTFDKLKQIIVAELGVSESEVTEDATIREDLGADSLDITELIFAIEEEFNVEIPDGEELENILTVRQLREYVGQLTGTQTI